MNEEGVRKAMRGIGIPPLTTSNTGWVHAHCPFAPWLHERGGDRHPSFGVQINERGMSTYYCYACKSSGVLARLPFDLYPLLDRQGDMHAAAMLILEAEAETPLPDYEDVDALDTQPEPLDEATMGDLYPPLIPDDEGWEYLQERGVRDVALVTDALGLRWDMRDRRVVFPVRGRRGELYGYTGRAVDSGVPLRIKDYFGLPKRYLLLAQHCHLPGKPILLVEGLIGLACLYGLGVHRDGLCTPMAVMGSVLTAGKLDRLVDMNEPVLLAFDCDEAGNVGLWGKADGKGGYQGGGAVDMVAPHLPYFVPSWPEGVDDPDGLSYEDVKAMLAEAEV